MIWRFLFEHFFARHRVLLEQATQAVVERGHWSPYPDVPNGKFYGETARAEGESAFKVRLGRNFEQDHPATMGQVGTERSPYGVALGIRYPQLELDGLFMASTKAGQQWRKAGPQVWVGVALEILQRLNKRSFEMAYAVMHTTGQSFAMAFQAGGPHAQDRGLEAVAWAWRLMRDTPDRVMWEKPHGKHAPQRMEKRYCVMPRGTALVIGCCTFPTWNSYPGLFASLATGNNVLIKPHPGAILPMAITVEIAREVLKEAGFDPNVVTLVAHDHGDKLPEVLSLRPEVSIIDFTGSSAHGAWLERHARQAQVYTEKGGINQIIIDSTDDLDGMVRNIALSLTLYSGQMCTAPQNIYIPLDGIDTPAGRITCQAVVAAIRAAIDKLTAEPARAVEVMGALQNADVLVRLEQAAGFGQVVVASRPLVHPEFPAACVRTPLLLQVPVTDEAIFMQEHFGPISFVVITTNITSSLALAARVVREHGALTLSLYTQDASLIDQVLEMTQEVGAALSINLTGTVFVNQSAAFSDFHGTGCNPAANASLTGAAFVANRYRVVQSRIPEVK